MCKKRVIADIQICDSDDVRLLSLIGESQVDKSSEYVLYVYEPLERIKRFKGQEFNAILELFKEQYIMPNINRERPVFIELLKVVEE